MTKEQEKKKKQVRRHARVRAKISGTSKRPRLNVFRSNKNLYLQLIDDEKAQTLVSAHTKELKSSKDNKTDQAFELGKALAKKAQEKKIKKVVFDKGCYKYHGRVESLARGAREGGLEF